MVRGLQCYGRAGRVERMATGRENPTSSGALM
ncbi:unnamed protein product [Spirodela intermedia]|uniref:Uncharacterized protein n=1 Tax=Spirodela intermedia TaxID=51605 RepID=A0A7I8KN60_SPIIN|nr:unnamed protein product [Spirodela intermedia]